MLSFSLCNEGQRLNLMIDTTPACLLRPNDKTCKPTDTPLPSTHSDLKPIYTCMQKNNFLIYVGTYVTQKIHSNNAKAAKSVTLLLLFHASVCSICKVCSNLYGLQWSSWLLGSPHFHSPCTDRYPIYATFKQIRGFCTSHNLCANQRLELALLLALAIIVCAWK